MKCYVHNDTEAIGFCTRCGKAICSECALEVDGKAVCKACAGIMAKNSACVNRKEPVLSLILSFFIPGVGQVYNGEIKKGIIMLVTYYFFAVATAILCFLVVGVCCLPFLLAYWVYIMYDAVATADSINKGEPTKDWL